MSQRTANHVKIATVADYGVEHPSHSSAREAAVHAADALGTAIEIQWFSSNSLGIDPGPALLSRFDGIFAPGGEYENKNGGLAAMRFARERGWPFFGT